MNPAVVKFSTFFNQEVGGALSFIKELRIYGQGRANELISISEEKFPFLPHVIEENYRNYIQGKLIDMTDTNINFINYKLIGYHINDKGDPEYEWELFSGEVTILCRIDDDFLCVKGDRSDELMAAKTFQTNIFRVPVRKYIIYAYKPIPIK